MTKSFVRPLKPSSMKTQKSAADFLSFSLNCSPSTRTKLAILVLEYRLHHVQEILGKLDLKRNGLPGARI
jgi:hypothetical protein